MLRSYGYLVYDPSNNKTRFENHWLILRCGHGLVAYYQYWLHKKGVDINTSAWGSHVSIVRGERPANQDAWRKYQGKRVWFEYSPENVHGRFGYWWIEVRSPELERIRVELGLKPQPKKPFHITIGKEIDWKSLDQRKRR